MIGRRLALVFASVLAVAAVQPAQAQESWSLFDWWAKPIPVASADWVQPAPRAVATAPAPRVQRVASVVEPVRRPPQRMLIIGIGF